MMKPFTFFIAFLKGGENMFFKNKIGHFEVQKDQKKYRNKEEKRDKLSDDAIFSFEKPSSYLGCKD